MHGNGGDRYGHKVGQKKILRKSAEIEPAYDPAGGLAGNGYGQGVPDLPQKNGMGVKQSFQPRVYGMDGQHGAVRKLEADVARGLG